jgi:hypothetical protein
MLEDLRDSPFHQHKLHLQSYLHGPRGAAIADAAAAAQGITKGEFLKALARLPELELLMPRPVDRARWTGTPDLVVVGTARTPRELASTLNLTGFTTGGDTVTYPVHSHFRYPYLLILPVRTAMGPDPEARRRAAPGQIRSSISTREDEFRIAGTEDPYYCDPLTVVTECQQPPTANSEPTGIWLNGDWSYARCTTDLALDVDQDGINDDCEYVIAHTFRPVLKVSHHDNTLGRESYWAVAKGSLPESFKIFYALAYYRDGGTDNVGFGGHLGDSEFIVLTASHLTTYTINSTVSKWLLEGGFLSAHWGHGMFDSSGSYGYSWFEYPAEYRGRPRIWVAEEKHANYRKRSICDGALWADTCDQNDVVQEAQVLYDANIGNSWRSGGSSWPNRDCVSSRVRWGAATECFWNAAMYGFWGWQDEAGNPFFPHGGPYHESLWAFGF